GQAAAASELLLENERLRRILNLPSPATWEHIPAEVILRDPRFWHEQFTIDRGSIHGIRIGTAALAVSDSGMPVFVGVVSSLSRKTATVMTVYNPELRMSAILPRSGAAGIIHSGNQPPGKGMLPVGFLPLRQPYTLGEVLQTSGFEQNIPPGLKIGNLSDVQSADSLFSGELYLSGRFIPAMRLNEVRFLILAVRKNSPAKGSQ
ncbi:MAG: rod shape-determining protein MreC, partial [Lentisphaeria bacterium]|nr:rod shape-determining protein MreC [Lentisphaeria bacterium]